MDKLSSVLLDEPQRTQQFQGIFDAVVTRSTETEVWFTIPDFSPHFEFAPARYSRPVPAETEPTANEGADPNNFFGHLHALDVPNPPEGTELVVAFVDGDPASPRVLSILGWPA